MMIHNHHRKNFFNPALGVSTAFHLLIFILFIFTLPVIEPSFSPQLSFLGSILKQQDIYPKSQKSLNRINIPSSTSSEINLNQQTTQNTIDTKQSKPIYGPASKTKQYIDRSMFYDKKDEGDYTFKMEKFESDLKLEPYKPLDYHTDVKN